ncbi:MAG: vsr [Herbaspirillum sp.]|nr:vsr [Herbaspirillum sp.]
MDNVSVEKRSTIMRQVRSKDTTPEWIVRRLVHSMGYRYRLHRADLPGIPDIAFISRRKVIFVHGCFWHAHEGCKRARIPDANHNYWLNKIRRNVQRDQQHLLALDAEGWHSFVLWECELRNLATLQERIKEFLDG